MTATYEPISTQTLGSTTTTVTFSSIPQTYTDLVVVYQPKMISATADIGMRYNSDTGTNYSLTRLSGNGSSTFSTRGSNTSSIGDSYGFAGTAIDSVAIIHIMNYSNTTTYKTSLHRYNRALSGLDAVVGLWRSTSAITSVGFTAVDGTINDFASGSTFTLYGIKAE